MIKDFSKEIFEEVCIKGHLGLYTGLRLTRNYDNFHPDFELEKMKYSVAEASGKICYMKYGVLVNHDGDIILMEDLVAEEIGNTLYFTEENDFYFTGNRYTFEDWFKAGKFKVE